MRANPPLAVIVNLGFILLSFHAGTIVLRLMMFMAISILSWLSAEDASSNRKLREIRPRGHTRNLNDGWDPFGQHGLASVFGKDWRGTAALV